MSRDRSSAAAPFLLGGSALVLVLGSFIGFQLLTASAETVDPGPTCEERVVAADEQVTSSLVKVNVYNSSRRAGLANRVSINLQRRGFLPGEIGNSKSEVKPKIAAILSADKDDPRVRLVATQFGKKNVEYVEPDIDVPSDAVAVVVGDDFKKLGKDVRKTKNDREFTVCLPTVPEGTDAG